MFAANTYVIWRFAQNPEAAKKFLVDYIGRFQEGFLVSGFQNMPSFPNSVSDFGQIIDIASGPSGRYAVLADVPATLTSLGDPGCSNAATDEVLGNRILSAMFARAAIGETTPRDAMDQAARAIEPIFDKWRDVGKI